VPKISCIMPTYNRYPRSGYTVEEAVESFLRQDHQDKELLIINDTAEQPLVFNHPQVKIWNTDTRFPDLSAKIQFAIDNAAGDVFCRWDDDDINLPWRLSLSLRRLQEGNNLEWRPRNYWFDPGTLKHNMGHGNSHVTAIWTRACLDAIGGVYPPKYSGYEDQAFNKAIADAGFPGGTERLPLEEVFYLYRWSTGGFHLSGAGGPPENLQRQYDNRIKEKVVQETIQIKPRWYYNHVERARVAASMKITKQWHDLPGWFDYQPLYDAVTKQVPRYAKYVEVGCMAGRSLVYLAQRLKAAGMRAKLYGVDFGVGAHKDVAGNPRSGALRYTGELANNIVACGVHDMVTLIAGESTAAADLFEDESVWFINIDADHTEPSVACDLQAWVRKVMPGGTIAGHDYGNKDFPGVTKAVDAYFGVQPGGMQSPHSPPCWQYTKPVKGAR